MSFLYTKIKPSIIGRPTDLAQKLKSSGIKTILTVITTAYLELYKEKIIKPKMTETEINEELFIKIQNLFFKKNIALSLKFEVDLVPIHEKGIPQKRKRGKFPTIDICFRDKFDRNSFFGAECKILEENKIQSYNLYIKEGLCRYLSGKYEGKSSHGSMIGYIKYGKLEKIIEKIQNKVNEVSIIYTMRKSFQLGEFKEHYESIHEKDNASTKFTVHHLFFSFIYD